MNVFVESNFVLEIVLAQEQHDSCIELLALAEARQANLILPAYSVMEPYETLARRHGDRKRLRAALDQELTQLRRSATVAPYASASSEILGLLIESADHETRQMADTRARLLRVASVTPLTGEILKLASEYQVKHDLSAQDAVVYASVVTCLREQLADDNIFVSRNSADFDDPDIRAELIALRCKYFGRFDTAVQFLKRS